VGASLTQAVASYKNYIAILLPYPLDKPKIPGNVTGAKVLLMKKMQRNDDIMLAVFNKFLENPHVFNLENMTNDAIDRFFSRPI